MRAPRKFYEPLAVGAPRPLREPPARVERMIHFVPPHVEKLRAKIGELAAQVPAKWVWTAISVAAAPPTCPRAPYVSFVEDVLRSTARLQQSTSPNPPAAARLARGPAANHSQGIHPCISQNSN